RHAVLVRPGRVEILEFDQHFGTVGRNHLVQPNNRSVSDGLQRRITNAGRCSVHVSSPSDGEMGRETSSIQTQLNISFRKTQSSFCVGWTKLPCRIMVVIL